MTEQTSHREEPILDERQRQEVSRLTHEIANFFIHSIEGQQRTQVVLDFVHNRSTSTYSGTFPSLEGLWVVIHERIQSLEDKTADTLIVRRKRIVRQELNRGVITHEGYRFDLSNKTPNVRVTGGLRGIEKTAFHIDLSSKPKNYQQSNHNVVYGLQILHELHTELFPPTSDTEPMLSPEDDPPQDIA